MADPIRQALESLLAAEAHIHVAGPEYVQARDAAYAALAADGERDHVPGAGNMVPAAYAARLRQCPTHGQLPANAWVCPECLRELREELARLRGSAADGEREELAQWLDDLANDYDDLHPPQSSLKLYRAAALLRQPAPAPVPVADGASSPTPEEIALLWDASNSPSVFAGLVLARWGSQPPAPAPAADSEREELAMWLDDLANDYDDLYPPKSSLKLYRAAALLREARPQPVPVADRPWERPGWCDAEGRCWFGAPIAGAADAGWILRKPSERLSHQTVSLPHWAIPQPPQGGEVEQ